MKMFFIVLLGLFLISPSQTVSETTIIISQKYSITRIDSDTLKFKGALVDGAGLYLVMAASSSETKEIILESSGGLMNEAAILASYLEESGVSVLIEPNTMCISACAYAVMKAKTIDIQGKVVFHPPFFPSVSTTETMYSIIHSSNLLTLELVKWFIDSGYSLSLLKIIYDQTNNDKFMVFDSVEDLLKFKSSDLLYVPENYDSYYEIITNQALFK